ncbi:MAG: tetratricopeptide repeat-containing sensor histidine kinase [Bacteroidetes bacterium]|nr:tetratricopeptide repeat-containing sensor histidine kinase [Bacteroidota bacterium]
MKRFTERFFIISALLLLSLNASADNIKLKGLWQEYNDAKHDTIKILLLNENIGMEYRISNPDSSIIVYEMAISMADNLISENKTNESYQNRLLYFKAISLRYIGIVNAIRGYYDQSIKYFFESLKIAELIENKTLIFHSINNIGVVLAEKGDYDEAIEYYKKSLLLAEERNDKNGMSLSYINIGNIYYFRDMFEPAVEYYKNSIALSLETNDKVRLSLCYNNIGGAYRHLGRYTESIEYLKESLKISEELGDRNVMAIAYSNIAELNISLSNVNIDKRAEYLREALNNATKSLSLANEINALPRKNEALKTLISIYKSLKMHEKAFESAEMLIAVKDSMFKEEKTKAVTEMQIKYDSEKKQQEIERQNLLIEKSEIDYRRQRLKLNFLIAGAALLGLLVVVIFYAYKQRMKNNALISQKNQMLEQVCEEVSRQKEELKLAGDELARINAGLEDRIQEEINENRKKDVLLIQQSRQAAMGEMIANIAHQWRQPLNAVGLIIQNFRAAFDNEELTEEYIDEKITKCMNLIYFMSDTITDFQYFFRPDKKERRFEVDKVVKKCISFVEDVLRKNNIEISHNLQENVFAFGFPNEYSQVVLNLIHNAKDAIIKEKPANPKIEIILTEISGKSCLTITDNGGGISPKNIDKVFDPYFSTKNTEEGTGLGLYMSKTIIEKHEGGKIEFENTNDGVRFIVIL